MKIKIYYYRYDDFTKTEYLFYPIPLNDVISTE